MSEIDEQGWHDRPSVRGVGLLFDRGERPEASNMRVAVSALDRVVVSLDRQSTALGEGAQVGDWMELLAEGMTFDLRGLAPGAPCRLGQSVHGYHCKIDRIGENFEAIVLEAGPHLAGGAHTIPVVRTQLRIASGLARNLKGVRALVWSPARSAIAPRYFCQAVDAWLAGGPFPALGLLGFNLQEGVLRTEGLGFFLSAELELDAALCEDRSAATRLAARIVHELIGSEVPADPVPLFTKEGGRLLLAHDRGRRTIEVRPG